MKREEKEGERNFAYIILQNLQRKNRHTNKHQEHHTICINNKEDCEDTAGELSEEAQDVLSGQVALVGELKGRRQESHGYLDEGIGEGTGAGLGVDPGSQVCPGGLGGVTHQCTGKVVEQEGREVLGPIVWNSHGGHCHNLTLNEMGPSEGFAQSSGASSFEESLQP